MTTDMQKLAAACNAAAEFYCDKPGLISAATVVDIYRILAVLAESVGTRPFPPMPDRMH
jgi:hypothetical protein